MINNGLEHVLLALIRENNCNMDNSGCLDTQKADRENIKLLNQALGAIYGNKYPKKFEGPPTGVALEDMFLIGLASIQKSSVSGVIKQIARKKFPNADLKEPTQATNQYEAEISKIKKSFYSNKEFWTNPNLIAYYLNAYNSDNFWTPAFEYYAQQREEIFIFLREKGWLI